MNDGCFSCAALRHERLYTGLLTPDQFQCNLNLEEAKNIKQPKHMTLRKHDKLCFVYTCLTDLPYWVGFGAIVRCRTTSKLWDTYVCLIFIFGCEIDVENCMLSVAGCFMPIPNSLLLIAFCLLPIAYCLLLISYLHLPMPIPFPSVHRPSHAVARISESLFQLITTQNANLSEFV